MTGKFYIVWNTERDKPARSKNRKTTFTNMYSSLRSARALRSRKHTLLMERRSLSGVEKDLEIIHERINYWKTGAVHYGWLRKEADANIEIDRETVTKLNQLREIFISGKGDKLQEIYVVYEIDLATGNKKMVVDGIGSR